MNENKISFIICVNNEIYFKECMYYLQRLIVPEGYVTEIIVIKYAESMASGYNEGMQKSDAKYKIYMHQDVFIVYPNMIIDMLKVFSDKTIGMLGVVGSIKLPAHGIMWYGERVGKMYTCNVTTAGECAEGENKLTDVEAIDGMLMATQYDLPWREDIFSGWDFYDVSQSFEFRKKGCRVVVPEMEAPWCIHDDGYLDLSNYHEERRKFLHEYMDEM